MGFGDLSEIMKKNITTREFVTMPVEVRYQMIMALDTVSTPTANLSEDKTIRKEQLRIYEKRKPSLVRNIIDEAKEESDNKRVMFKAINVALTNERGFGAGKEVIDNEIQSTLLKDMLSPYHAVDYKLTGYEKGFKDAPKSIIPELKLPNILGGLGDFGKNAVIIGAVILIVIIAISFLKKG